VQLKLIGDRLAIRSGGAGIFDRSGSGPNTSWYATRWSFAMT
jgi:hypothetical protein